MQRLVARRPAVLAFAFLLAAAGAAAAHVPAPQAPTTWRLVRVGRDTVPVALRTGDDGRPLLQLVEETLTLGPSDRVVRVTVMRAELYERMPCALLLQLRARPGAAAASAATPPPDTSGTDCTALRASRDTVTGTVRELGTERWLTFDGAIGRTPEPRALLVQRGDTLELRAGATSPSDASALTMRYVRGRAGR
jgi:hypothetical protein